jgi:glutathione S-transferase
MVIHGDPISGNCLKVKYTADHLGLPYQWQNVDVVKGEAQMPEFLALNPMGQVPAVTLDDGRHLAQSNAIIRYLARGSKLMPEDAYQQAKVDELLFWEQYSHEPYVAVCRFHLKYLGKTKDQLDGWRVKRGNEALDFMDRQLQCKDWFVNGSISIADIALLAYTRLADEGGFDNGSRKNVTSWISRCESELAIAPRH